MILHIGTNDAVDKCSDKIQDGVLNLKHHIEQNLPKCNVIISCPITRTVPAKAKLTIKRITDKFKLLKANCMLNRNVSSDCLGKQGLHMISKGTRRSAWNLISQMRNL